MTILEALVQLRDDLKLWVANNLRTKLNNNLGTEESGKILSIDSNGDVVTGTTTDIVLGDLNYEDTAVDGQYVTAVSESNGKISVSRATLPAYSATITANASDDDVIVLTGTDGTNSVTYSASHATSGVTAGTYKSVTVDTYGHVTAGTNPTTLGDYGITDVYTKTATEELVAAKIAEAQLGEGDVDLSAYYTKTEADAAIAAAIPTNISAFTNDKGYLVSTDLDNYATFDDVPNVINNLTSTSTTDALSANQGTVLKNYVDEMLGDIETLLAAL